MKEEVIQIGSKEVTYLISSEVLIKTLPDALDIIGNSKTDYLILHTYNFESDFFDLSTRKLGDILQKFTTYRIRLAIVGDFETYPSQTLKDFIRESNRHGDYLFLPSLEEVEKRWK